MKPLTPEQQAFAEEHHGLLLDFMAKHSLGDDYYDLLANRYLKVVVRYLSEEALRKYSFSTVVWYHLRSELSNYARDQVGKPQEMVTGARTLFDIYTNKCSPLPEWMKAFAFMT